MPLINLDFQLTVLRPNGTGVAGARIRVLTAAGTDVTAQLFGQAELITDSLGIWKGRETGTIGDALLYQEATVQVIAQYYDPWQTTAPFTVIGISHLTANLTRTTIANNYTVTPPNSVYVSSMTPIVFQVESSSTYPWEYIRATVTIDGVSSVIEAPVDKTTHLATLDIRNRINLNVRPFLVKEPAIARPDTDFSAVVTVSFSSLNDEGETSIGQEFTLSIAATLPPDGQTDLSIYVSRDHQPWIVPALPVIAFRGYYRDVMVWLPVPSLPGYVLTTKYYDRANSLLSTTTDTLSESPYVQRIRLTMDLDGNVARSELSIKSGTTAITQPLTVLYRD